MPFCQDCRSLTKLVTQKQIDDANKVVTKGGASEEIVFVSLAKSGAQLCRKCGWSSKGPAKPQVLTKEAEGKKAVVIEQTDDPRQQQDAECPKCGHGRAYFHLMQTRRSDEPPTEINECMECGHSWREY